MQNMNYEQHHKKYNRFKQRVHAVWFKMVILVLTEIFKVVFFPRIYYPQEVRSMKYYCLGLFRKEYFRLITK